MKLKKFIYYTAFT